MISPGWSAPGGASIVADWDRTRSGRTLPGDRPGQPGATEPARCRRKLAAFHPEASQSVLDCGPSLLAFTRGTGRARLLVLINPTGQPQQVAALPGASVAPVLRDHLSNAPVDLGEPLAPYAYHWLAWP